MKKILMLLALILGLMSCGGKGVNVANVKPQKGDCVEVIYFHGKKRCPTCMAIENNAKEVVNALFAKEVEKGKVVFTVVDISTKEGEAFADRYEVAWSSLFVNQWKGGKETRNNLTEFGFAYARSKPDYFKKGLSDKIRQYLK